MLLNQALATIYTNDDKSTQTDNNITEYKKQKQKPSGKTQEGTQGKSNSSPRPGKSNSSHHQQALKAATLEMMRKDDKKRKITQTTTKRRKTTAISKTTSTERKRSKTS